MFYYVLNIKISDILSEDKNFRKQYCFSQTEKKYITYKYIEMVRQAGTKSITDKI